MRTAFESVLGQTHADYEYIVVDGASSDETVAIIREYEPRFLGKMRWLSEPDDGLYDAINKGIACAGGEFVGILNADDAFSAPDILEKVSAVLSSTEHAQILYGDIRFVPNTASSGGAPCDLSMEPTRRYYSARFWRPWMLRWGFMPPHPSVYIRREHFSKLGHYKLGYRIAADYELLTRYLYKARLPAAYLNCCMVDMRLGGMSTEGWRATLRLNLEINRCLRENGYFSCLPMQMPKYAFKIFEFVIPRLSRQNRKTP